MRAPHAALRGLYRQASAASAFAARLARADAGCTAVARAFNLGPLDGGGAVAALLAGSAVDARLAPPLARLDAALMGDGEEDPDLVFPRRQALPTDLATATAARPAPAFDPERHPRIAAMRANLLPSAQAAAGGGAEPLSPEPHQRIAARGLGTLHVATESAAFGGAPAAAASVARIRVVRHIDAVAAQSALAAIAARSGVGSAHQRVVAMPDGQALDHFPSPAALVSPAAIAPSTALTPQSAAQIDRALGRVASRPSSSRPADLPRVSSAASPDGGGAPIAANAPPSAQQRRGRLGNDAPAPLAAPTASLATVEPGPSATAGLTGLRRLAALAQPAASPLTATAGDQSRPALPLPARPAAAPMPLAEEMSAILRREAERQGIDLNVAAP